MQVPGDPVAVLEQHDALLVVAGVGEFQRQGRVVGEGRGHVEVGIVEALPTMQPADDEGAAHPLRPDERKHHHRADRFDFGQVHQVTLVLAHVGDEHRTSVAQSARPASVSSIG